MLTGRGARHLKPVNVQLSKIWAVGLIVLSLGIIGFIAAILYQNSKVHSLVLAAGSRSAESYIVCAALKNVVERHNNRQAFGEIVRVFPDDSADRTGGGAGQPGCDTDARV